ncbi:MAG TPA: alpha/beta fold hydrolase [Burkholderiales bacterium]|nr:alpha/beta fold hydrolase [Burkholderiales bacterium]
MTRIDSPERPAFRAGYRFYRWTDALRRRPVWTDVWYPAQEGADEEPICYSLGVGAVARDAELAAPSPPFPLVVLSHGASGSATNYAWLAEYLARSGFVVLGVSHYGESWRYRPDTVDPSAATRLWIRPHDCTFALSELLRHPAFERSVDATRVAAVGHSSGGATAFALGGAVFDPAALAEYCRSQSARNDRGCQYARERQELPPAPPEATQSYRDTRVKAIVALDPAAGPGYSEAALAEVRVPVLVIGCEHNDFLPFEHHAKRYAALLPDASLIKLDGPEGHFVFLNSCSSDLSANGVSLCVDREGVDREVVHAQLAPRIRRFLTAALGRTAGT